LKVFQTSNIKRILNIYTPSCVDLYLWSNLIIWSISLIILYNTIIQFKSLLWKQPPNSTTQPPPPQPTKPTDNHNHPSKIQNSNTINISNNRAITNDKESNNNNKKRNKYNNKNIIKRWENSYRRKEQNWRNWRGWEERLFRIRKELKRGRGSKKRKIRSRRRSFRKEWKEMGRMHSIGSEGRWEDYRLKDSRIQLKKSKPIWGEKSIKKKRNKIDRKL